MEAAVERRSSMGNLTGWESPLSCILFLFLMSIPHDCYLYDSGSGNELSQGFVGTYSLYFSVCTALARSCEQSSL